MGEVEALCAEHPLHEPFWVQLVTALYVAGRQADAFAAVARVRARLRDELGADPGPALRGLEQRLLHQDPALMATARAAFRHAPLPAELAPRGGPFVGRTEELSWLHDAWVVAQGGGETRLLLIGGPAASGRTRLLERFAFEAHANGANVHYGYCGIDGVSILDNLDATHASTLAEGGGLRVATYDPDRADPALLRVLSRIPHEERRLGPLSRQQIAELVALRAITRAVAQARIADLLAQAEADDRAKQASKSRRRRASRAVTPMRQPDPAGAPDTELSPAHR